MSSHSTWPIGVKVAGLAVRKAGRDNVDLTDASKGLQDYIEREMALAFDLKNPDSMLRWKPNEAYNATQATNDLSILTGVQGSGRTIADETASRPPSRKPTEWLMRSTTSSTSSRSEAVCSVCADTAQHHQTGLC